MSLINKTISSVGWSTIATLTKLVLQLLQLSVLTFLLDKSTFGVIAIATMVIGITEIFSGLGLSAGLIHKQNVSKKEYSSLYWLNMILSAVVFLILLGITPLIVDFYNEPLLLSVIPLLGIQILLNAFGKIFQLIKTKELDFAFISKTTILSFIISFIVTIVLAYYNFGVYSLVIGKLIQVLINQGIYAYYGKKHSTVYFYINLKLVYPFVKIGAYQLGSQVLDYISSKLDVFLIGRFFGMETLGVYNIAKELILKPYQLVNSVVINVASVAFSRIQEDYIKVKSSFSRLLNLISIVTIPIYFFMFAFADTIVGVLYSNEFKEVSTFLQLMFFVGVVSSISSVTSVLIVAKGRTDIGFKWTIFRIVISTIVLFIISNYGVFAFALSQSILSIVFLWIFWYIATLPLCGLSFKFYLLSFFENIVISVLFTVIIIIIQNMLPNINLIIQIILMMLYVILYAGYFFLFRKEKIKFITNLLLKKSE